MSDFSIVPTNVIVYYRVSTAKQAANERFGLDNQTDVCDAYALKVFKKREKN